MVPAILAVTLVFAVLFVWKAGRQFPALAVLAALFAAALGTVLFRKPLFALLGAAALLALIYLPQKPRG